MKEVSEEDLIQHSDALFRFALARVKDRGAAQDLVQECLITAWQKKDKYEGRSSLSTWLFGILKFKVLDYYRKSSRTPSQMGVEVFKDDEESWGRDPFDMMFDENGAWQVHPSYGVGALSGNPHEEAEQSEVMRVLEGCVDRLPDRLKLLFSLRDVEGLTVAEAAAGAGVTVGSAGVLLTRARHKLRSCLQNNHVEFSD